MHEGFIDYIFCPTAYSDFIRNLVILLNNNARKNIISLLYISPSATFTNVHVTCSRITHSTMYNNGDIRGMAIYEERKHRF